MKIEVAFNNNFNNVETYFGLKNYVCAVIDVIRATTTIATILARGAKEILIAKSKTEAFYLKKIYKEHILCGEVGGHPPKGFDFGNSPLEFSKMELNGTGMILKTTNGTKSFFKSSGSVASFSLSLVNLGYVIDPIIKKAQEKQSDILFIASGEKGKTSYDDFYVAGQAIKYLLKKGLMISLTDNAKIALSASLREQNHMEALRKSISANTLITAGLSNDLDFCAKENLYDIAPLMEQRHFFEESGSRISGRKLFVLKAYRN